MLTPITRLFYPPACLLCQHATSADESLFCDACHRFLPVQRPPLCQQCGMAMMGPYDAHLRCQPCQRQAWAFTKARAPFGYHGAIREAIQAFKYRGHHRIGRWLAAHMARTASAEFSLADITRVVPVPMHWIKRRLRGDDPAAVLAQRIAALLDLPYDSHLLHRLRWTTSQTRLNGPQRFRNVDGVFRARGDSAAECTVLLVDDVLTSGATANSCASSLRANGVQEVCVLTAARASLP